MEAEGEGWVLFLSKGNELEDLNTELTNICFYHYGSWGRGLGSRKACLSPFTPSLPPPPHPHVIHYWLFQGSTFIVVL